MEKGNMRLEANISVSDTDTLGTKVEVKNINSFRAMERAVAYEIERQTAVLESGEKVVQETRGWDEGAQKTFSQRKKEGSADYRYFPDPDLPSLKLSEIGGLDIDTLRGNLPELPWARQTRYIASGVAEADALVFVQNLALGNFLDKVIGGADNAFVRTASNYIVNDLVRIIRETSNRDTENINEVGIQVEKFRSLVAMVVSGSVSSRAAKDILSAVVTMDADPEVYAKEHGLMQISDESGLEAVVQGVILKNGSVADDYRAGKSSALEFLVGQCMKALRGAGNPSVLREMLKKRL
jgi:aspartyl-tRNA(Asn)/glutamyl-tRNA(Gln) amidotransferase subunit B